MDLQDLENYIETSEVSEIDDQDFGVIITPDGRLKMLLLPDEIESSEQVPDIMTKILSLFESQSMSSQGHTIH
jgi:hypothetical protein